MYDNFREEFEDCDKSKSFTSSNIVLLLVTVVCVLLFILLIVKSMQLRNNDGNINIEEIENNNEGKEVVIDDIENIINVDNIDTNFYDLLSEKNTKEEEIENIKILEEQDGNSDDLETKISELFEIDIKTEKKDKKEDIKIDKNIKDVYLNEENKNNNVVDLNLEIISNKKSGIKIQLGAMKTNEFAVEYKNKLVSKYKDLFKNLEFFIEKVDLAEKGTFYRVQFGIFKDKNEAKAFCNRYIKLSNSKLSSCIVINE